MKLIAKTAAITTAAAISATGLVGAIGSSASAAPAVVNTTYTCTFSVMGASIQADVPMTIAVPSGLPSQLQAGVAVPAGTPVQATLHLESVELSPGAPLLGTLQSLGVTELGGSIDSFKAALGDVPVTGTLPAVPNTPISDLSSGLTSVGSLGSFVPAGAGTESLTLPSSFNLQPTAVADPQQSFGSVPCQLKPGAPTSLGSVNVVSSKPPLKATAKKIKAGHVAKIKVVTTPAQTGKAIAKIGKKKVAKATLKDGKATLKVKGLKKTTKVKVFVGSLKAVVKVKVKK
jgi:hypothetical protein